MEELKQKLIAVCNQSQLPLEAIYYVTKDLWRDVEAALREYQNQAAMEETASPQTTEETTKEEKAE